MKNIKEFVDLGLEVLFFHDNTGYHCEILKNDLYVLSIFSVSIEELEYGMNELLLEVKKLL